MFRVSSFKLGTAVVGESSGDQGVGDFVVVSFSGYYPSRSFKQPLSDLPGFLHRGQAIYKHSVPWEAYSDNKDSSGGPIHPSWSVVLNLSFLVMVNAITENGP